MQIKNLFLLACLSAATLLGANNPPNLDPSPGTIPNNEDYCDIPPPVNFHIEEVGTNSITYAWTNTTTFKHRIRTYRASDNLLLNTVIVPSGANIAIAVPVPSSTSCFGVINAIGADGCQSPQSTQSENRNTLIIDMLVNSYSTPDAGSSCTLPQAGKCLVSSTLGVVTPFEISNINNNDSRKFGITRNASGHLYSTYLNQSNEADDSGFDFKCQLSNPNCSGPEYIHIWYPVNGISTAIGRITVKQEGIIVESFLYFTAFYPDFQIDRIDGGELPITPTPGYIRERDGTSPITNQIASAAPNPFSETLDVFLANSSAETVQLQLFNLSGQQVLQQQFAGGQAQYTLSTVGLSPGFYMLRIEADGAVQTLKVVKSE